MTIFSTRGHAGKGRNAPTLNLGLPHISEIITLFGHDNFSARGRAGGAGPPSVNMGPLISQKLLELDS